MEKRLFQIPGATEWKMRSKEGLTYRIMLWQPSEQAPVNGFPVYYVLDANAVFGTLTETIRLQSRGPRKQEPAVIVGIGYDSDNPIVSSRRFVDYTIPANQDELPARKNGELWPANGGIEPFLTFIENELKPTVENEVSIDRSRQALLGHSLGGFAVLYTMFTRTHMFQYYGAGSPSVWWKSDVIFQYAEKFISNACKMSSFTSSPIALFIGVGDEEQDHMVEGACKLFYRLQREQIKGLQVRHVCFKNENHISVLLPFLSRVVRDFRIVNEIH